MALRSLPAEAADTYDLIQQGGPYPYEQDGTVFQNREGVLPACSSGYYHEYTVVTPGSDDRYFYTGDHYDSFQLIDASA